MRKHFEGLLFVLLFIFLSTAHAVKQVISSGNGFQSAIVNHQVYVWGRQGRIGDGTSEFNRTFGIPIDHNGVWAETTVSALSCGVEHMVALEASGKIYSWGDNTFGQIGDGTMDVSHTKYTPTQVSQTSGVMAGKQVTQVVAGGFHSIALTSNNQLFAWGYGLNGNLGDNGSQNQPNPILVNTNNLGGKQITQVAAGYYHSLLLTNDGAIYSWGGATGATNFGQLGNSATNPVSTPSSVYMNGAMTGKQAVKTSAGAYFSLALTSDGILFAWGDNRYGQLGIGNTQNQLVPVQVTMNGALSGQSIVQIATGYYHCMVLTGNNKLFTWGYNGNGELGDGTFNNTLTPSAMNMSEFRGRNISYITAGLNSLVVTSDEALYTWGNNDYSQIGDGKNDTRTKPRMVGVVPFTLLAAGWAHSLALSASKSTYRQVLAWGNNQEGQLGDGTNVIRFVATFGALKDRKIVQLTSRSRHALAIISNGTLYSWGSNDYGQLGDGTRVQRNSPVLVQDPNRNYTNNPTMWLQVSAGDSHTLVIADNGLVYSWGWNAYGQLGVGTDSIQLTPKLITSLTNIRIIQVSGGWGHSLALTVDGQVYSWGYNLYGQLGINSTWKSDPSTIVLPPELIGVPTIKIAAGLYHSMMLTLDGRVYCWGYNGYGQLGIGNTKDSLIPIPLGSTTFQGRTIRVISGGGFHSIAMSNDGNLYSWGMNSDGQIGDKSYTQRTSPVSIGTISGVIDIQAGGQHNLLATNSSVHAWGGNDFGQLGDNTYSKKNYIMQSLCSSGYEPIWFCARCPSGGYSLDAALSCSYCPAGKFLPTNTSTSCGSCPAGTASGKIGAVSSSACYECTPGTYSYEAGSSSCKLCPVGAMTSWKRAWNCNPCPIGTYASNVGSTNCSTCPSGTTTTTTGATSLSSCQKSPIASHTGKNFQNYYLLFTIFCVWHIIVGML